MSLNPIEKQRLREHVRKRLKALRVQLASAGVEKGDGQLKRDHQNRSSGVDPRFDEERGADGVA